MMIACCVSLILLLYPDEYGPTQWKYYIASCTASRCLFASFAGRIEHSAPPWPLPMRQPECESPAAASPMTRVRASRRRLPPSLLGRGAAQRTDGAERGESR
jgi:hypothetical protein